MLLAWNSCVLVYCADHYIEINTVQFAAMRLTILSLVLPTLL